ncbi:hypothetical protein HQ571_02890 [Candidatus Kuenenbacteria bacterium]|nr:hypothetical protein [Candidatus Kuenenbacteria bacterium]
MKKDWKRWLTSWNVFLALFVLFLLWAFIIFVFKIAAGEVQLVPKNNAVTSEYSQPQTPNNDNGGWGMFQDPLNPIKDPLKLDNPLDPFSDPMGSSDNW